MLDVPISAISFLDRDRVWFKAGSGFELADMAHSESFCRVAVQEAETLVVPDATLDERFRNHKAVQGEMGLPSTRPSRSSSGPAWPSGRSASPTPGRGP